LYEQQLATLVIISAGTMVLEGGEQMPEAMVMYHQALRLGLPKEAIVIEDQSQSTIENARYTKIMLKQRKLKSVLLITSAYQSRRAKQIFNDIFNHEISISIQPANSIHAPTHWMFYQSEIGVVRYEYRSWLRYWLS